jgi:2',3'-cyclic-nucleotide 2'-phosphodiesterase (5'-nucleotidase family)
MKKVNLKYSFLVLVVFTAACAHNHYSVRSIEGTRIEMNSSFDAKKINPAMDKLVNSYSVKMQNEMNEVIGVAAQSLVKGLQQSLLGNFTADAMKDYGSELWGPVDFAVMNVGGLRSLFNEGSITLGNIFEVYPFENSLVLLELPGSAVRELFEFAAKHEGGGCLSKGVELVIRDKKIESLHIGGRPLDESRTYRVATIDYLAEGNDGMTAFKQAVNSVESNIRLRDAMIEFIKDLTATNKKVDAALDNRVIVRN